MKKLKQLSIAFAITASLSMGALAQSAPTLNNQTHQTTPSNTSTPITINVDGPLPKQITIAENQEVILMRNVPFAGSDVSVSVQKNTTRSGLATLNAGFTRGLHQGVVEVARFRAYVPGTAEIVVVHKLTTHPSKIVRTVIKVKVVHSYDTRPLPRP